MKKTHEELMEARRAEAATKAAQTAELLTQDLRELHKTLCEDNPDTATRIAECYLLELMQRASHIHYELKGIAK